MVLDAGSVRCRSLPFRPRSFYSLHDKAWHSNHSFEGYTTSCRVWILGLAFGSTMAFGLEAQITSRSCPCHSVPMPFRRTTTSLLVYPPLTAAAAARRAEGCRRRVLLVSIWTLFSLAVRCDRGCSRSGADQQQQRNREKREMETEWCPSLLPKTDAAMDARADSIPILSSTPSTRSLGSVRGQHPPSSVRLVGESPFSQGRRHPPNRWKSHLRVSCGSSRAPATDEAKCFRALPRTASQE